jgi:uncharacterized membrane protein YgcG
MDLATIQIKVDTREVKSANDEIGKLGKTGTQTGKDLNAANDSLTKSTERVSGAYKALGGIMAALGVGALVNSFKNTVTETERLKGSLVTMTGSTENAAFAFKELLGFASTTPFTLDQSVEAFTKLTALGLDPSERALKSYGNTSAAMGKNMMQMIEAVADASTGEFERLKEFGIKASSQADQVSFTFQGVTTTVGKNAEEIQEYLLGIGEVNFAGAMEDQMQRLPGLLSNLSDQVTKFFLAIGEAGGVNLFGAAISAASAAMVFATENLDILGTAFMAVAAAAGIAFGPTMILAAIAAVQTAVIGLYTVIATNPFAALAMALGAAAVIMIRHFDQIKLAAQRAAINIQIGWNRLLLFLMNVFAPVLTSITDLFKGVQRQAIATWSAVKAATMAPLDALDVFNETFNETLTALEEGDRSAGVFGDQISSTESRIIALEGELETLNTEVETADDNFVETEQSLSDFKVAVDETKTAAQEAAEKLLAMREATQDVLDTIEDEREALHLNSLELEIRNNLQKAGVTATSELGQQIITATIQLNQEKTALDNAKTSAENLAKANEEAQIKIEEDTKAAKDALSGFFVDIANNGKSAFDNLATTFKNMLIKMAADFAASKVMQFFGFGGGGTPSFSLPSFGGGSSGGGGVTQAATTAATSAITGGVGGAAGATMGAGGIGGTLGSAGASIVAGAKAVGAKVLAAATNPVTLAVVAAAAIANALDKGGTPTSKAGFLQHMVPGAPAGTTFSVPAFASGFKPIGFAEIASFDQARDVIGSFAAVDESLTNTAKQLGLQVSLGSNDFGGYGPEGTGGGVFWGTAFEDGKQGTALQDQLDRYTKQWIIAVGGKNQVPRSVIDEYVGKGSYQSILEHAKKAAEQSGQITIAPGSEPTANMGPLPSHESGLAEVPYDGYVAELHAGERVLTAQQADAADTMSADFAALRGSIEEIMIAVARNTAKSYRLYDRWDKNGLPPERTT